MAEPSSGARNAIMNDLYALIWISVVASFMHIALICTSTSHLQQWLPAGLSPGLRATLNKVLHEPACSKVIEALGGSSRLPPLSKSNFINPELLGAPTLDSSDAESLRLLPELLRLDDATKQHVVLLYYKARLSGMCPFWYACSLQPDQPIISLHSQLSVRSILLQMT